MSSTPLSSAFLFALTLCTGVDAATCSVFDYAELKDMSVEELRNEYCTASKKADESRLTMIESGLSSSRRGRRSDESTEQLLTTSAEQCDNQAARIKKILIRNGIEELSLRFAVACKN